MVSELKKTRDLKSLKTKTEQQIKYLYDKVTLTEEEIYIVTKDFFSALLELEYQFSHEELLDELKKTYIDTQVKEQVQKFIKNIGRIEYNSNITFELEELKKFLEELQGIVDKLITEETKQNSKGFSLFSKQKEETIGELIEKVKTEREPKLAKQHYQEALKKYNRLNQQEQQLYFERLQEAYEFLKASLN